MKYGVNVVRQLFRCRFVDRRLHFISCIESRANLQSRFEGRAYLLLDAFHF